jgi:hypothetical protein
MTLNVGSWLGNLLLLWIGFGLAPAGQTLLHPTEIMGPDNCSAPGFVKQKPLFVFGIDVLSVNKYLLKIRCKCAI